MFICDISILHRYGKQALDEALSQLALTWQEAVLLIALERIPQVDLQLLSQMLQTDKGNVSRLLKSMEHRGLLLRRTLAHDARRKELVLAPKGESLLPRVQDIMRQWEQRCYQGLSEEQIQQYLSLSQTIIRNIHPGRY